MKRVRWGGALFVLTAIVGTSRGQAPLLVRMAFNDVTGTASLVNRGWIPFTATLEGGATYSTDLPPGRTVGRSIELFGGNNDRVNIGG